MKAAEKENKISLEDLIERERAALGPNQTKITLETFSKAHDQNSNYFFYDTKLRSGLFITRTVKMPSQP